MPKYKITDPQTGKTVTISGQNTPTQTDAEEIFQKAGLRQAQQPKQQSPGMFQQAADFITKTFTPSVRQFGQAVSGSMALGAQNKANQNQDGLGMVPAIGGPMAGGVRA
jgi:ABC-type transporter Mla subunit MlaD